MKPQSCSRHLAHRLPAIFLSAALGIVPLPTYAQTINTQTTPSKTEPTQQTKGFLDGLFNLPNICIGPFCINTGDVTEQILADQLRNTFQQNAPVTVSTNDLYPITNSASDFQPTLLYLDGASPEATIPPGDYILFVQTYCLQRAAASPNGHRYRLGVYGGTHQDLMQTLNQRAATAPYSHSELQGLSWFIQTGGQYSDMPNDMQNMVRTLIPEHQSTLQQGSFLDDIRGIGNLATSTLGYGSFDAFLRQELGDFGQILIELMQLQADLQQPQDWRTLSDNFFYVADNVSASDSPAILNTPWSQVQPNLQARFVTEGNANDIGVLMMRIEETYTDTPLTVASLQNTVTSLAAVPEGSSNVQPLAMTPVADPSWWEDFAVGFGDLGFFAGRQLCGAGRAVTGLLDGLCGALSDVQQVLRPDTMAGFPELSEIPDLGDLIGNRRRPNRQPDRNPSRTPANDNTPPPRTPANDNNPPRTPANDNNPPPQSPANDNRRPPTPANDNSPQA